MPIRVDNQTGRLATQLLNTDGVGASINLGSPWTGPTVAAPDFVKLLLEPPSAGVASTSYEVIYATVVNGSSTATVVLRGQEETTARTHSSGVVWACGPTAQDFPSSFLFAQNVPSASWDITHNLGKYPSVTVMDSAGDEVVGAVNHLSTNRLVISFAAGFSGSAALN